MEFKDILKTIDGCSKIVTTVSSGISDKKVEKNIIELNNNMYVIKKDFKKLYTAYIITSITTIILLCFIIGFILAKFS